MLKKKSIKLVVLGLLMPVLLIGCGNQSGQKSKDNLDSNRNNNSQIDKNSDSEEKSDSKTVYQELFPKYKAFANYLYEVDNDGKQIIDEDTSTPTLGEFTKKLKEESDKQQKPTSIEGGELFSNTYKAFDDLIKQINEFQTKLPTDEDIDEQTRNNVLNNLKNEDGEDLWLLGQTANKFMSFFENGQLTQEEICEIQLNLGLELDYSFINKEQKGNSPCGTFATDTYDKFASTVIGETEKLGKSLDQIKNLIADKFTQIDTGDDDIVTNGVSGNAGNVTTDGETANPIMRFLLVYILGIITILLPILYFKYKNYFSGNILKGKKNSRNTESDGAEATNEPISIQQQINNLQEIINKSFQTSAQQQQQITELNNKVTQLGQLIESEYSSLTKRLEQLESQREISSNQYRGQETPQQSIQSNFEKPDYAPLMNSYANNPRSFVQQGTKVRMTTETTNKVLDGTWNGEVNFEEYRNGEYLIINNNDREDYVFLDPMTKFNNQTLGIINKSQLFICHGNLVSTVKGEEIEVRKPAKVRRNGQYWTLVESGELILS